MFCPVCGTKVNSALYFCSRCGGKLEKRDKTETPKSFQSVATAAGGVGLGGMVLILILVTKLAKQGLETPALIAIIFMFLLAIVSMVYMIIRLVPKYLGISGHEERNAEEYIAPQSFRSITTAQLEEPKDMPASVVEQTTRTLDEVLVKRH